MSRFVFVFVLGLVSIGAAIYVALLPPFLGFGFQPRMILESSNGALPLDSIDLTQEPGEFTSFEEFHRFFERQDVLFSIINAPKINLHFSGAETTLHPRPMRASDLHWMFWVQLLVGVGTFFISGWVFLMRARTWAGFLFFLAGVMIWFAGMTSAIYTTRELALPQNIFKILAFFNAIGGGGFGITIMALFLIHPLKAPAWKTLMVSQVLVFGVWTCLYAFEIFWANLNYAIVVELVVACFLLAWQFWLSRHNVMARATLTWLGISLIFGGGAFVVFNTVPVILEITPLDQSYSFLFLLIIFLGMAAGLTEFRLYEVQKWVFSIFVYLSMFVAFVLVNGGFVFVLKMSRWSASGLALVLILILYLPMRESLKRFMRKKELEKL